MSNEIAASKPPKVKVMLDTNVLFNEDEARLFSNSAEKFIETAAAQTGLIIEWLLPDVVSAERFHQMNSRAVKLLTPLGRLERLIGHKLAMTEEILGDRVNKVIANDKEKLGVIDFTVDYAKVDWPMLVEASTQRKPPFADDKSEKGFRDALILEAFSQLVDEAPSSPQSCRLFLVTSDGLLETAAQSRLGSKQNVSVVSNLDELRTMLTAIGAHLSQSDLERIIPEANKIFFSKEDDSSLYYKKDIYRLLMDFQETKTHPDFGFSIVDRKIFIDTPTFLAKHAQTLTFSSSITIKLRAEREVPNFENSEPNSIRSDAINAITAALIASTKPSPLAHPSGEPFSYNALSGFGPTVSTKKLVQFGEAEFLVTWKATLSTAGNLIRSNIEGIILDSIEWNEQSE